MSEPITNGQETESTSHLDVLYWCGAAAVIGVIARYALPSARSSAFVFDLFSPITLAAALVDCVFIIVAIILAARSTTRARLGIFLSYAVVFYIISFAGLYWDEGTSKNFSHSLTKLDALYVAIGTLTTSGTGNLTATSEVARATLAIQMTFDFALVAVALSVIVARFLAPRSTQRKPT